MTEVKSTPALRFPEFEGEWESKKLGEFAEFSKGKGISKADINPDGETECIRYGELYTEYSEVIDEVISRTSVDAKDLVLSEANDVIIPASGESPIDIATASCVLRDKIALGGDLNIIKAKCNGSFLSYYLNYRKKGEIACLAQGNTVVHLYSSQLKSLSINKPSDLEQQKLASFLSALANRFELLKKKKEKLQAYKNGVIQHIFSQQIRFKDEKGNEFPEWEKVKLKDVLFEHKKKNKGNEYSEVFSVAKHKGVINQIEHLGRSYAAQSIEHYKLAFPADLIYTKSPTSGFPFGIIKQNQTGRIGVLSPLYAVFTPKTSALGTILHNYFLFEENTYNYLVPLVQKGAKNTMNINNDDFLNGAKFNLPVSEKEQQKIASFLTSLDKVIEAVQAQLDRSAEFKKGLLQQLFV